MASLFGATTASISAVQQLVSITPASGISTLMDGFTGLFKAVGSIFTEIPTQTFPMANPLFAYASYTYVIGIAGLTDDDLHNPDSSYLGDKRLPLICKSAGADPHNRVNTSYGMQDFFVDDIQLESLIGMMQGFNTNVSKITFKVIEPYSMGLFMIACQQLAQELGHKNWRDAPFLLTIEFRGNTEGGAISSNISGASRYIPFKFTNIDMKVDEQGSVYTIKAMPYNQAALTSDAAKFKSDVTVSGTTVQEALQTGAQSLQAVVNARNKQLVDQKLVSVADEILILFPQDVSSSAGSSGGESNAGATTSATTSSENIAIFKKMGVSRSTVNHTLVQEQRECNVIGKASMGFSESRAGSTPMGKANVVYNEKLKVDVRANNTINVKESEFKFAQSTDIPNAINQIILQSDFIKSTFEPANLTAEGYRSWFRIDVQTYNIGEETLEQGVKPKLYVYRVVPYSAHASNMMPPNTKAPGYENLKRQVVKAYNYIYTGKNVDVISFNIQISNGFQSVMAADGGRKTMDVKTAAQTGGLFERVASLATMGKGNAPGEELGVMPSIVKYIGTITGTDGLGGGGAETQTTRAARTFMDAVTKGTDMINLKMDIIGDPYYIAHSGTGNYTAKPSQYINLNTDGSVNYQNGEVVITVDFRTPIDINQGAGLYSFGGATDATTAPVMQFSGMYKINRVINKFFGGEFKQTLVGQRLPRQESLVEATSDQTFNTGTISHAIEEFSAGVSHAIEDVSNGLGKVFDDIEKMAGLK